MNWAELKESVPKDGFAEKYEIYRRARPTVTLIVLRTVTDPILFRSTDSERAETQEFNGVIHAQVNGEKFVSKERLTGLNLCRKLDEGENIISGEYTYNEPVSLLKSQNADMLTYGLAGTVSGKTFSQKSHVIEGYTYSLEPYDLMNKELHNAPYESGTMLSDKIVRGRRKQSESLFNPVKVQPGTHFVHFVTLEAGTKEMLLYLLYNIFNTGRYGARETRTGRNMKNEVVGLITSAGDSSLSCGEMISDYITESESELSRGMISSKISNYINEHKRADWNLYYANDFELDGGSEFPKWLKDLISIGSCKEGNGSAVIKSALETIHKQGLKANSELNEAVRKNID